MKLHTQILGCPSGGIMMLLVCAAAAVCANAAAIAQMHEFPFTPEAPRLIEGDEKSSISPLSVNSSETIIYEYTGAVNAIPDATSTALVCVTAVGALFIRRRLR